jgi:uncharacterized protein YegP (UPF0339 family)
MWRKVLLLTLVAAVGLWAAGDLKEKEANIVPDASGLYYQAGPAKAATKDALIEEGFEGAWPPAGWTDADDTDYAWDQSVYGGAHTGVEWAYNNLAGAELISPEVTIVGDEILKFWYRAEGSSNAQALDVYVGDDLVISLIDFVNTTYEEATFALTDYAGETVAIKFVGQTGAGGWAYGLCLDDVSIAAPPTVPVPALNYTGWNAGLLAAGATAETGDVFEISNGGGADLTFTSAVWADGSVFSSNFDANATVVPGAEVMFGFDFAPLVAGDYVDTLWIETNADTTFAIALSGAAYGADAVAESFEGAFPPLGWEAEIDTGTYNWEQFTWASAIDGEKVARYNSYSASSEFAATLYTPWLDMPVASDPTLHFYYAHPTSYYDEEYMLLHVTADGENWDLLDTVLVLDTYWHSFSYDLSAYSADTIMVAFTAVSDYGTSQYLDLVVTPPVVAASTGNVAGVVTSSEDASVLEGAVVTVLEAAMTDTTDALGAYEFELPEGSYTLEFAAPGYYTATETAVEVLVGEETTVDMALDPVVPYPPDGLTADVFGVTSVHLAWNVPINGEILWDQLDPMGETDGAAAQDFEASMDMYDSEVAGDFILTEAATITQFRAVLFYNTAPNTVAVPFNIAIYPDEGGAPGETALFTTTTSASSLDENDVAHVDLATPITLEAGTYWIGYSIIMDYAVNGQAYAMMRDNLDNATEGYWRNPLDGFESGFTTWTDFSTSMDASRDLAFQIIGEYGSGKMVTAPNIPALPERPVYDIERLKYLPTPLASMTTDAHTGSFDSYKVSGVYNNRNLMGYNVYRDDVAIAEEVLVREYNDIDLAEGTYEYHVTAVYEGGLESDPSNTAEAVIDIPDPLALPFMEGWDSGDFDANLWTVDGDNWRINLSGGMPAPAAQFYWSPSAATYEQMLTSYLFDATTIADNIFLEFDVLLSNWSTSTVEGLKVEVYDGEAWTVVADYDNQGGSFSSYEVIEITDLVAEKEFQVRFTAYGDDTFNINWWYVDNISVKEVPFGFVSGVVTDLATGDSLAGAKVASWDGLAEVMTNADGEYLVEVQAGLNTIIVSAEGYQTANYNVQVVKDDTVSQDAMLAEVSGVYRTGFEPEHDLGYNEETNTQDWHLAQGMDTGDGVVKPISGNYMLGFGPYQNDDFAIWGSSYIQLVDYATATIKLKANYAMENGYDNFYVLAHQPEYDGNEWWVMGEVTGSSNGEWVDLEFDMSMFTGAGWGSNVEIGFAFISDFSEVGGFGVIIDEVYVEGSSNPILAPENLTAVNFVDNQVPLSWDAPKAGEKTYKLKNLRSLEYVEAGRKKDIPVMETVERRMNYDAIRGFLGYNVFRVDYSAEYPEVTKIAFVTETEYLDEDVVNEVPYEYTVTALYEEGESMNTNWAAATPGVPTPEAVDYVQDFEDVTIPMLPAKWSVENMGGNGWATGNSGTASSDWMYFPAHGTFAFINDDAAGANVNSSSILWTPPLDATDIEKLQLKFNSSSYTDPSIEAHKLVYRYAFEEDYVAFDEVADADGVWEPRLYDISEIGAGEAWFQIGFFNEDLDGWGYGWAVDDVEVSELITGHLAGVVKDTSDNVLADAKVVIDGAKTVDLFTDENGEFMVELPIGNYDVMAQAFTYYGDATNVDVLEGDTASVAFELVKITNPPSNLSLMADPKQNANLAWNAPPPAGELSFDDGTAESWYWVGGPSSNDHFFAVLFDSPLPAPYTVSHVGILALGEVPGAYFENVYVAPVAGWGGPDLANAVAVPNVRFNGTFDDGADYVMTEMAAVMEGGSFWVLTQWIEGGDNGPFVGTDTDSNSGRCFWSDDGANSLNAIPMNFIIRAYLEADGEVAVASSTDPIDAEASLITDGIVNGPSVPVPAAYEVNGSKAVSYNVYRSVNNGDFEKLSAADMEYYLDEAIVMDTTYSYYVTAVYPEGETAATNTVSYTPVAVPFMALDMPEIMLYERFYEDDRAFSELFTISNPGLAKLGFDLEYSIADGKNDAKDIDGAFFTALGGVFAGVNNYELPIILQNNSPDAEWIDTAAIWLPDGFEVNDATMLMVPGTDRVLDLVAVEPDTIDGEPFTMLLWADPNGGFGEIWGTEWAYAWLNMNIAPGTTDLYFDYWISGDEAGNSDTGEHDVWGTYEFGASEVAVEFSTYGDSVEVDASKEVTATITTNEYWPGFYVGMVTLTSNDPNQPELEFPVGILNYPAMTTLTGTITSGYDNSPVEGAEVVVGGQHSAVTDENGVYTIEHIFLMDGYGEEKAEPYHEYDIVVMHSDYYMDSHAMKMIYGIEYEMDMELMPNVPAPSELVAAPTFREAVDLSWVLKFAEPAWLQWDSGTNDDGIGLTDGGTFDVAAHWDADMLVDYEGLSVAQVAFFPNETAEYIIGVWGGEDGMTPIYTLPVEPVAGEWNYVDLPGGPMLEAGQGLWVGYNVTHDADTYPAGCDAGPAVAGYGDLIKMAGETAWAPLSGYGLNYNWNIAVYLGNAKDGKVDLVELPVDMNASAANLVFAEAEEKAPYLDRVFGMPKADFVGFNVYRSTDGGDWELLGMAEEAHHMDHEVVDGFMYEYYVTSVFSHGESEGSETAEIMVDFVGVEDRIPMEFAVHQNYPNPFNPVTTIQFDLPEATDVNVTVYNMMGQVVKTLVNGNIAAGYHNVQWDGVNDFGQRVSTGIYIYRVVTPDHNVTKKMVFLK